ncbi:glycosyltransferase family 4 protein [Frischella perrara]|uniref:glycosyltransferase family 4 protein n=1 Tax=Frischella perrara TaxID=1267021 RepID=UPI0023EF9FAF|nr:glycosyltransferase family 4 protein [Frischella perrara]MCT6876066.1 glycosyltransferase family 4 protein [Frischella perrara]
MKKIIFIVNSLKHRSGVERVVSLLANELSQYYAIEIINRNTSFNQCAYPLNGNVKVKVISGKLPTFFFSVKKYLSMIKPDVIIIHNMGKLSLLMSLLPRRYNLWSYEHVSRVSRPKWINWLGKNLYKRFDKIITLTYEDKIEYEKLAFNIDVVFNPSPYELVDNYNVVSKSIIAAGRLTHQKGFDLLIRAWDLIANKYPDWRLDIYGEGIDKQKLKDQIDIANINNIHLLGSSNDMEHVYKNASFYVMSSRYEGLPMVLIEAQTFALPIVSFNCPYGPKEIITNDEDGILVENGNIEQLATSIESLIISESKRISMSKNAIESAKRFSIKNIITEWRRLLK